MHLETPEEIRADIEANPFNYLTKSGDVRVSALNKLAIAAANIFYEHISASANIGCGDEEFKQKFIDYYGQNQDAISILSSCALLEIVKSQMIKEGKPIENS